MVALQKKVQWNVLKHVIFKEYVVQKNTKTENYIVSELPLPTAEVNADEIFDSKIIT